MSAETAPVATYHEPTEDQAAFYRENGYLILENAIEPIGLARVREAYERREAETKAEWEAMVASGKYRGGYGNGPDAHTISPDFDTDTTILDLVDNPAVIPYVKTFVGPDYQAMGALYHNHHAGTKAHTRWHRDWPPWTHPQYTLKVKVFYFLDDQDEDMGCFALVPGTNGIPDGPPRDRYVDDTLEDMPGMKKMALNAGDAVFWDVTCWHTGTANRSTRDRRMVITSYMPFWVKRWNADAPPESLVAWADSPMRRQLMGIHAVNGRRVWDRRDVDYLPEHEAMFTGPRE